MTVVDRPVEGAGERDRPGAGAPAPVARARPDTGRRRGAKVGAGFALIVVASWLLSSFWVSVQVRSPRQPFAAPTAGQTWVRSPQPGHRAFFRLRVPVFGSVPQSVTLWVEGSQEGTAYVNGYDLAPTLVAPIRLIDTAPDVPKAVQMVDIRPAINVGLNVVGVEVVSLNGQAPAFRARVELRTGGRVEDLGVSPSAWRSTTNARLTGEQLPESGTFSRPRVDDGNWVPAVRSSPKPGSATQTVPPDSFTRPATDPALIGSYNARNLIASRTVTFPQGCTEGWLRVAATGPYSVSLDGRAVATGTAGTRPTILPLSVFDLCPVATPGRHLLTVATSSSRQPVLYLDGMVRSGSRATSFATGTGWTTGSGAAGGSAVGTINSAETELGVQFARTPGSISIPAGPLLVDHLTLLAELLVVAALVMMVACACGLAFEGAVGSVACGLLPAVGLLLVLAETNHIVYVQSPFPNTPLALAAVLAVALVGVVVTSAVAVRRSAAVGVRRSAGVGVREESPAVAVPSPPAVPVAAGWLRRHWYQLAVVVTGVGWSLLQSYHIMFNPLWQDELSSLAAAQGMRAHILPQWPSGFLYWKSELYTALIAVIGGITHDSPTVLREVSVVWFGATVLLFGLVLVPLVLKGRRIYQLAATVVFATAPFELGHATDIRMYQMVQCIVVLVAYLLLRAMQEPTTRRIAVLMVAVVAMYLTHEESFGILFIIPLALFGFEGLRWTRNWRWWVFGGAAAAAIAVQLALALLTHPPIFGVDPSGGPLVSWSPQPFYYLANFFLANSSLGASITVVSYLAVLGLVVGVVRKDAVRLYLAAFWLVPLAVVSLLLANKDTRYVFITLPFVFALAACGTVDIIDAVRRVVLRGSPEGSLRLRRGFVGVFAALSMVAVMLSLIGGLNDYGTFTQSLFNANVSHRWLDYPTAVTYVKAHMEPGDAVISSATPNLVGSRLGRAPDYWIPPHRTETLLYVFEHDGQAVDTQYGIPTIFNAKDFTSALEGHRRVWLIGPDSALRALIPSMRQIVSRRFTLQEDGEYVSVFLATGY